MIKYIERTEITGLAKMFLQDNRQVMKSFPDASIDLILTDPPYNISKYSSGNIYLPGRSPINNDIADWDKEEIKPEEYVKEFRRILKPNGNIFVFTSYNCIGNGMMLSTMFLIQLNIWFGTKRILPQVFIKRLS